MSHGRKPRRPRWPARVDILQAAKARAAKMTPQEVATIIEPTRNALVALREGRATEREWLELACAVTMALSIEKQGVVRGLIEHLNSADNALTAIAERANQPTGWRPTALYFQEIEAVATLVSLFAFQLGNLSGAEFEEAHRATLGRNATAGGTIGEACRRSQAHLAQLESAARKAAAGATA